MHLEIIEGAGGPGPVKLLFYRQMRVQLEVKAPAGVWTTRHFEDPWDRWQERQTLKADGDDALDNEEPRRRGQAPSSGLEDSKSEQTPAGFSKSAETVHHGGTEWYL